MKKRLLILVIVGVVLILVVWGTPDGPAPRRAVGTNGPVLLSLTGRVRSSSDLTPSQLEGMAQRWAIDPEALASRVTNALIFHMTNRSAQSVQMLAYDSGSPRYDLYTDGPEGLQRLDGSGVMPSGPTAVLSLGPNQGLSFPVMAPSTDKPWRLSVSYQDFAMPAAAGLTVASPTRLGSVVKGVKSRIPFLREREPAFYWVMSGKIEAPEPSKEGRR